MNEKVLEKLVDAYMAYFEEHPCERFDVICPNFDQPNCSCAYDFVNKAECINFIKSLLTNSN